MKFKILPVALCVIFLIFSSSIGIVYCSFPYQIDFVIGDKVFNYDLNSNIKTSKIFYDNYIINKYNRFGSNNERINLFKKMTNLGFDKSVALEYLFPNLNKKIDSIAKNVYVAPKDAQLKINSQSAQVFNISKEIIGKELDKTALIENISHKFLAQKDMVFNLPIKTLNPDIFYADLQKFTNLRSDFSTDISSSNADRKHNVKNALMRLNKIEILPNEIFSFNKTIGKRTIENGYRQAKIIVNNEFVDGLGGGVCQVSTTLYNSALLAGLEIIEANKHSKQVGYVKYGFDAMVNFGSSDLKFKNNTNEKITIITNFSNNKARIRLYGESLFQTKYQLKNKILNVTNPNEEILFDEKGEYLDKVTYDDEYFYLKTPSQGMEIMSYREKYVNGNLVSTELLRHDKYKVQNAIKIFGVLPRNDKKDTPSVSFLFNLFHSLGILYLNIS